MNEKYKQLNEYIKNKYERITVLVPKGDRDYYKSEAEKRGLTTSKLFLDCTNSILRGEYSKNEN